jgi:hypothetical protein
MPKYFHGDHTRGDQFWVYPPHKTLVNLLWDCHYPFNLCDNHTFLQAGEIQAYRCNGHDQ